MYTYGSEDCEWVHESTAEGPHSGDGEVQIVSLKGVYRKMFYLYFPDGPLINRLKMIKFGFDLAEIIHPKVWRRKTQDLQFFDSDSAVSFALRSFLKIRLSRWNRNWIRKYFSVFPDGFE